MLWGGNEKNEKACRSQEGRRRACCISHRPAIEGCIIIKEKEGKEGIAKGRGNRVHG